MGQSIDEIEDQLAEIQKWEDHETRKVERKEEHRIRVAEQRRIAKELAALDSRGSEVDKAATALEKKRVAQKERRRSQQKETRSTAVEVLKKAVKSLAQRLKGIPNDFKCKQCGVKKVLSKQWVVDLANQTAICRVCFELNKR